MTFVVLIPYYGVDTWRTSFPWSGLIWKSGIIWGLFIFTSCSALLQSFSFHFNIVLLLFLRVYGKRKWQIKRLQSVHLNTTLPQILLTVCLCVLNMMIWIELDDMNWIRWYDLIWMLSGCLKARSQARANYAKPSSNSMYVCMFISYRMDMLTPILTWTCFKG